MRIATIFIALSLLAACGGGATTDAGPGMDAGGGGTDGGAADAGGTDAGPGTDAGDVDAGPLCEGMTSGACLDGALDCMCCPAGGPTQNCLCTTTCVGDSDCTDPARPHCNTPTGGGGGPSGICTPLDFTCAWMAVCASPDTPILTPEGERPIAELAVGDLVYTRHEGRLVARPLIRVNSTPVADHAVVRVTLDSGRVLEISGPHPTADGRPFGALSPGDFLDETPIVAVETIPYEHAFTYDVLPDSDSGTYVAGGVLIGSTLTR